MPVSDIDICNMALGHLGKSTSRIQSFTERSIEAQTCAIWYHPSRREMLEAHDWSFARKRLTLALHADDPPQEWAFRYQAPSDMLALRAFWNPFANRFVPTTAFLFGPTPSFPGDLTNAIPYELEVSLDGQQLTILTNQESAVILYTFDNQLTQMFSPAFVNADAHYLASKMAHPLTSNARLVESEVKAAQMATRQAAASDANQRVEPPLRDGSAVRARL